MTRRDTLLVHPWTGHRRSTGLSQRALAGLCGVSEQVVLRLEQGLFTKPSPSVMNILSDLCDLSPRLLRLEYVNYQHDTRQMFRTKFPSYSAHRLNPPAVADPSLHPLRDYYTSNGISRIGICKGWCVHPAPLTKYEENKQRSVPTEVARAWSEMGWDVEDLIEDVDRWRREYR